MAYPYDASRAALFYPARGVEFFPDGRPATEAALCAEMSRLVYAPFEREPGERDRVQGALERIGFTPGYLFSAGGTQGLLTTDADRSVTILAFRGTEVNRKDWATDLEAWPRAWAEGGRVHGGFAEALAFVWSDLAPRVASARGRRLYTGHSLGAALATLAASRLPPQALFTYGSPRVGTRAFVRVLSSVESHRYTNCCDVVSRLPLPLPPFNYRHFGPATYLDREGAVHKSPGFGTVIWDRLIGRLVYLRRYRSQKGTLLTRDFADHAPVNYFRALSQMR